MLREKNELKVYCHRQIISIQKATRHKSLSNFTKHASLMCCILLGWKLVRAT